MDFSKNTQLDQYLQRLNRILQPSEQLLIDELSQTDVRKQFPTVIKIGLPRTGGTLLTQWALSSGLFYLPTNFLSRFHRVPAVGTLISELIANPELDYRSEFSDVKRIVEFSSDIGKTRGLLAPHEFWYFWRSYLHLPDVPVTDAEFVEFSRFPEFNAAVLAMQAITQKPLFLKGHLVNFYLDAVIDRFDNFVFFHMRRNLVDVAKSLYRARIKWTGTENAWFSHKPRQYDQLKDLEPIEQVAGQVYFIEAEIESKRSTLGDRYLSVDYETICNEPRKTFDELVVAINKFSDTRIDRPYQGPEEFHPSARSEPDLDEKFRSAFRTFYNNYGPLQADAT